MLILILTILIIVGFSFLYSLLPLSAWFWFLYPFLGIISTAIFYIIIVGILYLIVRILPYDNKFKHKIAWHIMDFIRIIFRLKIEVIGKENIPDETFVVFGNHKSMLDVVIVYYVYHKVMSAVAKKNLMKVPVLNSFMKAFEVVPIDRENEREGVRGLLHGIKLVKGGYNMAIFPEGGIKSREVETMVGFKAGAFKLATKADAVISPISIIGSSKIHLNFPKHKSNIKVIIHEPITKETYENKNTFELGEEVREIIDNGVLNG